MSHQSPLHWATDKKGETAASGLVPEGRAGLGKKTRDLEEGFRHYPEENYRKD
ncbi:hypothetical protein I79_017220 [Cricetulus griseus]|uniref:Uncharacterized protein n=1 Tax=Cricetulus griseus TaxID=10029 RepID=G3I1G5_CRIGR|nr:hypothetical protein I79_017220 [Cricetulus griseus]